MGKQRLRKVRCGDKTVCVAVDYRGAGTTIREEEAKIRGEGSIGKFWQNPCLKEGFAICARKAWRDLGT